MGDAAEQGHTRQPIEHMMDFVPLSSIWHHFLREKIIYGFSFCTNSLKYRKNTTQNCSCINICALSTIRHDWRAPPHGFLDWNDSDFFNEVFGAYHPIWFTMTISQLRKSNYIDDIDMCESSHCAVTMDLINLSLSKQKNNTGRTTIKNHAQFVVKTTSNTTYIQRKRRILIEKMRAPTTTTDPDWSPQLDRYLSPIQASVVPVRIRTSVLYGSYSPRAL